MSTNRLTLTLAQLNTHITEDRRRIFGRMMQGERSWQFPREYNLAFTTDPEARGLLLDGGEAVLRYATNPPNFDDDKATFGGPGVDDPRDVNDLFQKFGGDYGEVADYLRFLIIYHALFQKGEQERLDDLVSRLTDRLTCPLDSDDAELRMNFSSAFYPKEVLPLFVARPAQVQLIGKKIDFRDPQERCDHAEWPDEISIAIRLICQLASVLPEDHRGRGYLRDLVDKVRHEKEHQSIADALERVNRVFGK